MNEYKVTGKYYTITDAGETATHRMCRVVEAMSAVDAEIECDATLPVDAWWDHKNPQVTETLASLERRNLDDWNAGKPTASPLALAQARGEL
jgi:DNA-binding PadR family transcriptional regulator